MAFQLAMIAPLLTEDDMAFEGSTEDRLAIHELVAAYGDAVSRQDADDWGATWAQDAIWELPNIPELGTMRGRDVIVENWIEAMKPLPININIQTLGGVSVDGNSASGRVWASETVIYDDGTHTVATGRYDDEYTKQDGQWLFARRVYTAIHATEAKP
jgi:ketosteroid isomerase-like protein